MKIKTAGEVLSISQKMTKGADSRPYNLITIGFPGYEKFELFMPEEYVPDQFEGKKVNVELEVGFNGWKPYIKIVSLGVITV